jgi:hypothetical protein
MTVTRDFLPVLDDPLAMENLASPCSFGADD